MKIIAFFIMSKRFFVQQNAYANYRIIYPDSQSILSTYEHYKKLYKYYCLPTYAKPLLSYYQVNS